MGDAILIAGPTASGKSGLALRLARESGGAIVNADSMQVYSTLRVLTARPSEAEMEEVPHHLYGHVPPSRSYSTGEWLRDVEELASSGKLAGRTTIFVGGTGLYFQALTCGLSRMPDIADEVRRRWRLRLAEEGAAELHSLLGGLDPAAAAMLRPSDGQRIVRALEVIETSGRSIVEWQRERSEPLVDLRQSRAFIIEPDREELYARIDERFDRMLLEGAADEVRALLAQEIDPAMPARKAIGVPEIAAALAGVTDLATAIDEAKRATRRYAKRQSTWFRNQTGPGWSRIAGPGLQEIRAIASVLNGSD